MQYQPDKETNKFCVFLTHCVNTETLQLKVTDTW